MSLGLDTLGAGTTLSPPGQDHTITKSSRDMRKAPTYMHVATREVTCFHNFVHASVLPPEGSGGESICRHKSHCLVS